MPFAKGSELTPDDQRHVLASYTHRYTRTHRPVWASRLRPSGEPYPVQFASDAEWLANTTFTVRNNGRLDMRVKGCTSEPTWPDNPELRKGAA